MNKFFLEGRYIVTLVGSTNGVIECNNAQHMKVVLEEMLPNPGDPTLAYLLDPDNWISDSNGAPYNAETLADDGERGDYKVAIYRVMEVEN